MNFKSRRDPMTRLFIRTHQQTNKTTTKEIYMTKDELNVRQHSSSLHAVKRKRKKKKMNHNHAHKIQKSLLCNDCNHSHGVIVAAPLFFLSTTAENKENFFHFLCGVVPPEGVLRRSKRKIKEEENVSNSSYKLYTK
jgi:ABC-type nickel/cobalt efflux system permease component RcnA